ncbi:phage tail protein [Ralstonia wenshanensis]|uniref:phage tail protein n=1 Tax=Ralstonia wenshanensis TaxID=2842456 RepID=UPI0039C5F460
MRRISTATKVVDKWGPGKPGFTDGNAVTGIPATDLEAQFFDSVQEELCGVVEAAGLTADGSSMAQVLAAIRVLSTGVVGSVRRGRMTIAAASASATYQADELVVASALGDQAYRLASVNSTINLATVGAGGMDVGAAPANGYVALYEIYNPTTKTRALLGVNATAAVAPQVYGGANMPAGYTASALVSVWPTNGSGQFVPGGLRDRRHSLVASGGFTTATVQTSFTSVALSGVPMNAVRVLGNMQCLTSAANITQIFSVASDAIGSGSKSNVATTVVANNGTSVPVDLEVYTPQTLWYKATNGGGTPSYSLSVFAYDI